ncbi:hypothetical protein [Devosia sp.]|nr:hypothetical protein [Devosia sp.]
MMRALAWIGLFLACATVASFVLADDGMATCQINRSFDVCHDAIY